MRLSISTRSSGFLEAPTGVMKICNFEDWNKSCFMSSILSSSLSSRHLHVIHGDGRCLILSLSLLFLSLSYPPKMTEKSPTSYCVTGVCQPLGSFLLSPKTAWPLRGVMHSVHIQRWGSSLGGPSLALPSLPSSSSSPFCLGVWFSFWLLPTYLVVLLCS